ncbi:WD40-repeat-containing domain protein [Kockiozyma suomiensis]|uniref:WD40-repeat-containing domain protein n=1 Tax=Kockiozyma suomiensis TaxID=1337062 RepID=UPI0033430B20
MAQPSLTKRSSFSVLTQPSLGLPRSSGPASASAAGPGSSPGLLASAMSSGISPFSPSSTASLNPPLRAAYFESHKPLYAIDWSLSAYQRGPGRIAVATCTEDSNNRIQILQANPVSEVQSNGQQTTSLDFNKIADAGVTYPCTRLRWDPFAGRSMGGTIERLATAGDFLRIWEYNTETMTLRQSSLLANKTKSDYTAPLTSLDWNATDNSLVITSSIDTTCTIWDLNTSTAKTQLIAHDKEVFDARFTTGNADVFASVGADGSVRVFDLRSLEHSTIIYEPVNPPPLLRISTNSRDPNMLATFSIDSNVVHVLDIRSPGTPVVELDAHMGSVNAVEWAPQQRNILATSSDDCQVLVWDITSNRSDIAMAYTENAEVNNLAWNASGDWIAAVAGRGVQGVRLGYKQ